MIKDAKNKMQLNDTDKSIVSDFSFIEGEFFFPEHGVTIIAASLEEATAKLQEIINKK